MNIMIKKDTAKTISIQHPKASWSVFIYDSQGNLFVNSDWGIYACLWRAYLNDFEDFLKSINAEYLLGNIEQSYSMQKGKRMPENFKKNLLIHCQEFLEVLKTDIK